MAASATFVRLVFAAFGSLAVFMVGYFFPNVLQSAADNVFSAYIQQAQLRLYLLEGIIIGFIILTGVISTANIRQAGRREGIAERS